VQRIQKYITFTVTKKMIMEKEKMLLPKEKALEILNKFIPLTRIFDCENGWSDDLCNAQDAALIVVDIILNDLGAKDWANDEITGTNYWMHVKYELESIKNI